MRPGLMLVLCALILAAGVLGIVELANHDGRSPMEKFEDQAAQEVSEGVRTISLATCPEATLGYGERFRDLHGNDEAGLVVPDGATAVRLCRYYGFGNSGDTARDIARVGKLAAQVRLRRPEVIASIVGQVNALEHLPADGEYTCPENDGSEIYAIFGYAAEPPVLVSVSLSGCQFGGSENGPAVGFSTNVIQRLERLTR